MVANMFMLHWCRIVATRVQRIAPHSRGIKREKRRGERRARKVAKPTGSDRQTETAPKRWDRILEWKSEAHPELLPLSYNMMPNIHISPFHRHVQQRASLMKPKTLEIQTQFQKDGVALTRLMQPGTVVSTRGMMSISAWTGRRE